MKKLLLIIALAFSLFAMSEECKVATKNFHESSMMATQYERAGRYDKAIEQHNIAKTSIEIGMTECKVNKQQLQNLKNIIKQILQAIKKAEKLEKAYQ